LHRVELPENFPRIARDSVGNVGEMRFPFSAVACCGLPNQPVGAIERTSVSTGWNVRVRRSLSILWPSA
jgi:hypothetical protein